jgi:hypothetical protein
MVTLWEESEWGNEMQYMTLLHRNVDRPVTEQEWDTFLDLARDNGMFQGGSGLGDRWTIGDKEAPPPSGHIGGYMRFEAESVDNLLGLLEKHPTIMLGGTIEICEMTET